LSILLFITDQLWTNSVWRQLPVCPASWYHII